LNQPLFPSNTNINAIPILLTIVVIRKMVRTMTIIHVTFSPKARHLNAQSRSARILVLYDVAANFVAF
jgi:hypothetical protein